MGKFEKGVSGNPGGRPKLAGYVREVAREHTAAAIQTLVNVMNDLTASPSARVSAANAILDRGYGKPTGSTSDDALEEFLGPLG
jgi:hypothetical protein